MTKSEISEIARKMAAMRKRHSGGRPKKLTPCPFGCGIELGVAAMRRHVPECRRPKETAVTR